MSFNEYMESKIPGYVDFVLPDQLSKMEELYDKSESFFQNAHNLIDLSFQHPEMDYENDRKKNMDAGLLYKKQLDNKISLIMNNLGISSSDENNKPMKM